MVTYLSGGRIQGSSTAAQTAITTTDGSDTVLKFTESGTFTPAGSFNIEYLVVAGGGAGAGYYFGGGGGAGGLRTNVSGATSGGGGSAESTYGVTAQAYTITIGAGGVPTYAGEGTNGSNSSIVPASGTSIISTGGGAGGFNDTGNANSGGSGGGADGYGTHTGGSGTANQGYAGGIGAGSGAGYGTGGGGGAGAVGVTGKTTGTGVGGVGLSNDITGSATFYAGGGGGSNTTGTAGAAGGNGGGGTGSVMNGAAGTIGTANTGGGGGGTGNNSGGVNVGGNGGSGIVIIRFATSGNSYTTTMGTVDEKIAITNVPDGTRYEETDTRKIYIRKTDAAGLGSAADGVPSGTSNDQAETPHANLGTKCYSFAGSGGNSFITTGLTQNLGQQFSVAFWIKFATVSNWRNIMGKGDTDGSEELALYLDGNSSIGGEATPHTQLDSGFTPTVNTWYHAVYTFDGDANYGARTATSGETLTTGGLFKQYVNGVLKNGEKTTWGDGINDFGTEPLVLGYILHAGTGDSSRRLHGKLSQTLIYNDVLTQAEITALYNNGNGVATPNGNSLLAWYDFQETSGNLLNKQSTSAVPDGDWVLQGKLRERYLN